MRISLVLLLFLLLIGCAGGVGNGSWSTEQRTTAQRVVQLNQQAEVAFQAGNLTKPVGNNAYHYYSQALQADDSNLQARQGLTNIAQVYAERAAQAIAEGRLEDYRYDLSWVKKIAPSFERLTELQALDPTKLGDNIWLIQQRDLKARNQLALNQIKQAAIVAKRYQSRVKIVAPSDGDGRWIYQQMRQYADDYLFRSSLILGKPTKIVALDAPSQQ